VSTWLHEHLRQGDRLQVTLPYGDLALDTSADSPVVLVSAGIGATPMVGMLRHIAANQPHRQVVVLHADGDAADAALVREMVATVSELPTSAGSRLSLWFSRSRAADPLDGRVDERMVACEGRMQIAAEQLPHGAEVYLCGSNAFLQGARAQLQEAGVDADRIHFELFSPNDWLLPA